jgi:hypothetical protein
MQVDLYATNLEYILAYSLAIYYLELGLCMQVDSFMISTKSKFNHILNML